MLQTTDSVIDDQIHEIAVIFAAGFLRSRSNGASAESARENPDDDRPTCLDLSAETRLSVLSG